MPAGAPISSMRPERGGHSESRGSPCYTLSGRTSRLHFHGGIPMYGSRVRRLAREAREGRTARECRVTREGRVIH